MKKACRRIARGAKAGPPCAAGIRIGLLLIPAFLLVNTALGAFLSARLSGSLRSAVSPVWAKATGLTDFLPRAVMAFAGGFVLLIGARLAGGSTSGHGISGIAQLAVSSMIAVAAMFAGGIVTALLFRKV